MSSSTIKGFYKQKKKSGVSKKKSGKSSAEKSKTAGLVALCSDDIREGYGEEEAKLSQFDMDMAYGPCLGITRLQRWNRAMSMGLQPPPELGSILEAMAQAGASVECLWDGRV